MDPVATKIFAEVDVDELWVLGDVPVIVFGSIEVLDEVVPDMPFPDNITAGWSGLVDLDEEVWAEI